MKLLTPDSKPDKRHIPNTQVLGRYTRTQIWPRNGEVYVKGEPNDRSAHGGRSFEKPAPKPEEIIASTCLEEARKVLAH